MYIGVKHRSLSGKTAVGGLEITLLTFVDLEGNMSTIFKQKSILRIAGIIASIAIIGFLLTGCPPDPNGASLSSIEVTTEPTQTQYNLGDAFNPDGMVVTATYDDESTEPITGYTVNGFDSSTTGDKNITVSYGGKTSTPPFIVNVRDPSQPYAELDGSQDPAVIMATVANFGGNDDVAANITLYIELNNSTVDGALSAVDVKEWFVPQVAGLTYTADAAAGADVIEIQIAGTPTAVSTANVTITIPANVLKDNDETPITTPLIASGNISYNINKADDPAITNFAFTPVGGLKIDNVNTAANATVGSFGSVTGGTAGSYIYTLVEGVNSTDNALFTIEGADLKVGGSALTAATWHYVRVEVRDIAGTTREQVFNFNVAVADLPPPSNIQAVYSSSTTPMGVQVQLSWDAVPSANTYVIYRSELEESGYTLVSTVSSSNTSTTDFGPLVFDKIYYYKIATRNSSMALGEQSSAVALSVNITPLTANTPAAATLLGNGASDWYSINVTNGQKIYYWTEYAGMSAPNVSAYQGSSALNTDWEEIDYQYIYYFTATANGTVYIQIQRWPAGTQDYSFVYNSTGIPPLTPPATFNTVPSPLPWVVRLNWSTVTGADEYVIYRSNTIDGVYSQIGIVTNPTMNFNDGTGEIGTTYFYKITAKNAVEESAMSNAASGSSAGGITPLTVGADFTGPLSIGVSSFGDTQTHWYAVNVTNGTPHWIHANATTMNRPTNRWDIRMNAFKQDGTSIGNDVDTFFGTANSPINFTPDFTGVVYVRVRTVIISWSGVTVFSEQYRIKASTSSTP